MDQFYNDDHLESALFQMETAAFFGRIIRW